MGKLQTIEKDGVVYEIHTTKADASAPNAGHRIADALVPLSDAIEDYIDYSERGIISLSEVQLCKAIRKSIAIEEQARIRRANNPKSGKMPQEAMYRISAELFAENPEKYVGHPDVLQQDVQDRWIEEHSQ